MKHFGRDRSIRFPLRGSPRGAFTIIEILVVVGVILVVAAILGVALSGGDASVGIRTGERIAAGYVQAVRAQAVLKQTTARLIISKEVDHRDRYLRYLGVVYRDPSTPGENIWIAADDGTYLPRGVYFHASMSSRDGGGGSPGTMVLEFPRRDGAAAGTGEEWYYYQFESGGITEENAGGKFVLAVGMVADVSGVIEFRDETAGGFILHRLGGISLAQDPADLKEP